MRETTKADSITEALDIVDVEYGAGLGPPPQLAGWPSYGSLVPLSDAERQQLDGLASLIVRFARDPVNTRPLCFAVFGPPGSGKSFAVRQLLATDPVRHILADTAFHMTTINLTQVTNAAELAGAVSAALVSTRKGEIPLLFFDEFDAPRDGAAYGWLSWFLAPMYDGEFLLGPRSVPVARAIFAFAGGTAATMSEFAERRHEQQFRDAKGPDFVSRLRGYLDVAGPNAAPRRLRRAFLLRAELQKRVQRHGTGTLRFNHEMLKALLQAGRYRHGARSIAALIDLCDLPSEPCREAAWDMLPDDQLVDLFVDRGPLDPRAIGGAIALSGFATSQTPMGVGGASGESGPPNPLVNDCWTRVAAALWDEGATLAFAGSWGSRESNLTQLLLGELERRPSELRREMNKRHVPDPPRFRSFLRGKDYTRSRAEVDAIISEDERRQIGVVLEQPPLLSREEREWLDSPEETQRWKARTLERFRRRLASTEQSVARFVVGGRADTAGDRPSGIVQEALLSLALEHPIYVAGGFGGAARDLGVVLGLDRLRTGAIPESLTRDLRPELQHPLAQIAERLRPPPLYDLPVSVGEQIQFLRDHALGGKRWPPNGLTVEENRTMFHSTNPDEVAGLVVTGLQRRFAGR